MTRQSNDRRLYRCAIYTRKSSEEGLDQAFNSLDAQWEACFAYIKSQAGQGWQPIKTRYDDGGISAATMNRPALQALLADAQARKIDVVVVYKVDRLTRSLMDFAKIVEIFDAQGVSFVSITQQFNTTTSMGRLTLNMLLSFAQFEREVTGERIRDKIAASKRKGMWMGGHVPLGYEANGRTLAVNEAEAQSIKRIFSLYLQFGNVHALKAAIDKVGIVTKRRLKADGTHAGGQPLSRGHLYKLLSNPLYAGRITHKEAVHEGQHPAIIDVATWDRVQVMLSAKAPARKAQENASSRSLLAGLIFDAAGRPLTPSHASKKGRRYRYYVSPASHRRTQIDSSERWRLPAIEVEQLVIAALGSFLDDTSNLIDVLQLNAKDPRTVSKALEVCQQLGETLDSADNRGATVHQLVSRVVIDAEHVELTVSVAALVKHLSPQNNTVSDADERRTLRIPVKLRRNGLAMRLVIGDTKLSRAASTPDPTMVRTLGRAQAWFEQIRSGKVSGPDDIAAVEGITASYVVRLLRLAFLAPDLTLQFAQAPQTFGLTAEALVKKSRLPLAWAEQRQLFSEG